MADLYLGQEGQTFSWSQVKMTTSTLGQDDGPPLGV
jgi:hypothetical protein